MHTASCPACSGEFEVDGESGAGELVCPSCGCRIRNAPRSSSRSNSSRKTGSSVHRIYSDLEARARERRTRTWTLLVVFGVLSMVVLTVLLVVLLAMPKSAGQQQAKAKEPADIPFYGPAKKAPVAKGHDDPGQAKPVRTGRDQNDGDRSQRSSVVAPPALDDSPDEPVIPIRRSRPGQPDPPAVRSPKDKPSESLDVDAKTADSRAQNGKAPASATVYQSQQLLESKLRSNAPVAEVVKLAEDMVAIGPDGKEAACRQLCRALVAGKNNSADTALQKINQPLCTCVRDMLRDESQDVQMNAVRQIGNLGADSVPMAAFEVLVAYRGRLRSVRKPGSKLEYQDDPCAGDVIEAMFSAANDEKKYRDELRKQLTLCLRTDPNTFAQTAAARHIADLAPSDESVTVLTECLIRASSRRGSERNAERVKRIDALRVTVIQCLVSKGFVNEPKVKNLLARLKNDPAKEVRDEAGSASGQ
jgi:hypothetical protein